MKYILIIADGAADLPQDALKGKTPLEAAQIPNTDRVARSGRIGTVRTVPPGFQAASDVAVMSILGARPADCYTGRAPLEAASLGIRLASGDWAARCNLVTITDGRMADYSAGHITNEEAASIVAALNAELGRPGTEFHAGKSYRNLLVLRNAGDLHVETTPPHDIAGQAIKQYLPAGPDADIFRGLMDQSAPLVAGHNVNARRRADGAPEVTGIWLWGQGRATSLPDFREKYGISAAVITAVDLVAGICALSGWERIVVPGATGYYDTDYRAKAAAAIKALRSVDLVLVHVEAPDEASHNLDLENKIRAIENIDKLVVGPLLDAAAGLAACRLMVMADHYTLVASGAHGARPVPFAMCGDGIAAGGALCFSEKQAADGVRLAEGPDLIELFAGKT